MCSSKISRLIMMLAIGVAVFLSAAVLFGQKDKKDKKAKNGVETLPEAPAVLWREPTDITTRDLFLGPGGDARPDLSHITFLKVDVGGHTAIGDASVGTDTFTGVNNVRGSNFNDTMVGSDNAPFTTEKFEGRGGDDFESLNGSRNSNCTSAPCEAFDPISAFSLVRFSDQLNLCV